MDVAAAVIANLFRRRWGQRRERLRCTCNHPNPETCQCRDGERCACDCHIDADSTPRGSR